MDTNHTNTDTSLPHLTATPRSLIAHIDIVGTMLMEATETGGFDHRILASMSILARVQIAMMREHNINLDIRDSFNIARTGMTVAEEISSTL